MTDKNKEKVLTLVTRKETSTGSEIAFFLTQDGGIEAAGIAKGDLAIDKVKKFYFDEVPFARAQVIAIEDSQQENLAAFVEKCKEERIKIYNSSLTFKQSEAVGQYLRNIQTGGDVRNGVSIVKENLEQKVITVYTQTLETGDNEVIDILFFLKKNGEIELMENYETGELGSQGIKRVFQMLYELFENLKPDAILIDWNKETGLFADLVEYCQANDIEVKTSRLPENIWMNNKQAKAAHNAIDKIKNNLVPNDTKGPYLSVPAIAKYFSISVEATNSILNGFNEYKVEIPGLEGRFYPVFVVSNIKGSPYWLQKLMELKVKETPLPPLVQDNGRKEHVSLHTVSEIAEAFNADEEEIIEMLEETGQEKVMLPGSNVPHYRTPKGNPNLSEAEKLQKLIKLSESHTPTQPKDHSGTIACLGEEEDWEGDIHPPVSRCVLLEENGKVIHPSKPKGGEKA